MVVQEEGRAASPSAAMDVEGAGAAAAASENGQEDGAEGDEEEEEEQGVMDEPTLSRGLAAVLNMAKRRGMVQPNGEMQIGRAKDEYVAAGARALLHVHTRARVQDACVE